MSATYGVLRSDRSQTTATKSGTAYVAATAQTFRTFATVTVRRDGRVNIEVRRDDRTFFDADISAEDSPITIAVQRGADLIERI